MGVAEHCKGILMLITGRFLGSISCMTTLVLMFAGFAALVLVTFNYTCVTWLSHTMSLGEGRPIYYRKSTQLLKKVDPDITESRPRYYIATDCYAKYNSYLNKSNVSFPKRFIKFLPRMDKSQMEQLLNVFFAATNLLKQLRVPYLLIHGSLLGAHRHQNLIPWDTDIDLLIDVRDLNTIKAAFGKDAVITIDNMSLSFMRVIVGHFKICLISKRHFSKAATKSFWPFIDLFLYKDNGTHLNLYSPFNAFPKARMFPVQWRPFAGSLQPVPCDTEYVLKNVLFLETYPSRCKSNDVDRIRNKFIRSGVQTVLCEELREFYPFVDRIVVNDGKQIQEILTVDNTVVTNNSFPIPVCGDHT